MTDRVVQASLKAVLELIFEVGIPSFRNFPDFPLAYVLTYGFSSCDALRLMQERFYWSGLAA